MDLRGVLPQDTVFGAPFQVVAKAGLPIVFTSALRWLKRHALTAEGLFRKKGDGRAILLAKRAYEAGKDPIATGQLKDPHTVAGVLKLWLSCLPCGVVPATLSQRLIDSQAPGLDWEERVNVLRAAMALADQGVLETMYGLCEFLHHYSLNQRRAAAGKGLPPTNLATLFAPMLLELPCGVAEPERRYAAAAVGQLIDDYRPVFTRPCPAPEPAAACEPVATAETKLSVRIVRHAATGAECASRSPLAARLALGRDPLTSATDSDSDAAEALSDRMDGMSDDVDGGEGGACWEEEDEEDRELSVLVSVLLECASTAMWEGECMWGVGPPLAGPSST